MCQRAYDGSPLKKYPHRLGCGILATLFYTVESVSNCIFTIISCSCNFFSYGTRRACSRSSATAGYVVHLSIAHSGLFSRAFVRSKSTICVVNYRLLPLLSLLRSSVSMIPDKSRQSFLLWSIYLKEALEVFHSLRPFRRNGSEIAPTGLLDRNHFLVLVNGRSPPQSALLQVECKSRSFWHFGTQLFN